LTGVSLTRGQIAAGIRALVILVEDPTRIEARMSFLWYWPAGGWDFDKWKSRRTWQPIRSEQSGTHELVPPCEENATAAQWREKRAHWQSITDQLLGTLAGEQRSPDASTDKPRATPHWEFIGEPLEQRGRSSFSMRRLRYALTDEEWGYAWLLLPESKTETESKPATVIALHQTTPSGKHEVIGLETVPGQTNGVWFGRELVEAGFAVFAPDAIAFGERQAEHPNAFYRSADDFFRRHPDGSVMAKMAYDVSRAIDVIEQLPQLDAKRLGCAGHSHGGYGTLFAMLADERIAASVISCGVSLLRHDPTPQRWWRRTALIPRLGFYEDRVEDIPLDFHIWLAMLAPRPVLVVNATSDKIFPNTRRLPEAIALANRSYRACGADGKLRGINFDGDHAFPEDARRVAYDMLRETLRS
jgi:dienelactone hydrolase